MISVVDSVATDTWLFPILKEILPEDALRALEPGDGRSLWRAVVDRSLLTDRDVLESLSTRTHFRIATDLLVSSQACETVPEWLARKLAILPLAISDSTLDIETLNPSDLAWDK